MTILRVSKPHNVESCSDSWTVCASARSYGKELQDSAGWHTAHEVLHVARERGLDDAVVDQYRVRSGEGYVIDMWRLVHEGTHPALLPCGKTTPCG